MDNSRTQSNTDSDDNHVSTDAYKESNKSWKKEGDSWTFTTKKGDKLANVWFIDSGQWYHFNKNGVMDKNTTVIDDDKKGYILREDGTLKNPPNREGL